MCGRYGFTVKDAKDVYERFAVVNELPSLQPRYNIAPGQLNPVIVSQSPNKITLMFWGLIPHFAKDENYKYKTINAKAETVAQLPTFRTPFRFHRCLVPATYFFEPDKVNVTKPPYPWHLFKLKQQDMFAFAGLYDTWKDNASGKEFVSYTIITTEPNALVGNIHPRMPAIVRREDEGMWLNPDISEPAQLLPLLQPYPADEMEEWQVGDAARNPRNETAEIIRPVH